MTARPTVDQLDMIAEWVETYDFVDGDDTDNQRRDAHQAFIAWVEHLRFEEAVRAVAREAAKQVNMPVNARVLAAARQALKDQTQA